MTAGFNYDDEEVFFCSKESLEGTDYPMITENSFSIEPELEYAECFRQFEKLLDSAINSKAILSLCVLRITSILTSIYAALGINFSNILIFDGCHDEIQPFLQVYDRSKGLSEKIKTSNNYISATERYANSILLLNDDKNDSKYLREKGIGNVKELYNKMHHNIDHELNTDHRLNYPFLLAVCSNSIHERLDGINYQRIQFKKNELNIDGFNKDDITKLMYEIDKMIVYSIIKAPNNEGFNVIRSIYENYDPKNQFTTLAISYDLLNAQCNMFSIELPDFSEIKDYLINNCNDESYDEEILEEFTCQINRLISNGTIKIVRNCKLSSTFGAGEYEKVIYYEKSDSKHWIHITDNIFEELAKISGADNVKQLHIALKRKGLLLCDSYGEKPTYKHKVKLYDKDNYENLTTVNASVLETNAMTNISGGIMNFHPIQYDDKKVKRTAIGKTIDGKNLYYSYGHPDCSNSHIVIIGESGCGKSYGMNYIAMNLLKNGENVIYIHFKGNKAATELENHGFTQDMLQNVKIFKSISDDSDNTIFNSSNQISVIEYDNYNDKVEEDLKTIYNTISKDQSKEVYIVIDEAHKMSHKKNSALYDIYSMGRGNGVHLITAYQNLQQLKRQERNIIQSSLLLAFKSSNKDTAYYIAEQYLYEKKAEFSNTLCKQSRRNFIAIGKLEDTEGNINEDAYIQGFIPDLQNRDEM